MSPKFPLLLLLAAVSCLVLLSDARSLKPAYGQELHEMRRALHSLKSKVVAGTRTKRVDPFMVIHGVNGVILFFNNLVNILDIFLGATTFRLVRRDEVPASPADLWNSLETAADTMEQLSARVERLMATAPNSADEDLQRLTTDFSEMVERLDDLRPDLTLDFNSDGRVVMNEAAEGWAAAVLDDGESGIADMMAALHEWVMGGLVANYWRLVLEPQRRGDGPELETLVEDVLDMERLGYSYWVMALALNDADMEQVEQLMTERLLEQSSELATDPLLMSIQDSYKRQ